MANAAGYVQESIWRDDHWRKLSRSAQALYLQLLSQKELDCCGILPLQVNKWAKGCDELTVEQVWADLEELQRERFAYFDVDTDEAFIRTYMRNSNVVKSPNMRKSASRSAILVGSETLKPLLAAELRLAGTPELVAAADQIDPSGTVPEPFRKGLIETLSEPFAKGPGVGVGVGVGVTLVGSSVGERPSEFCKEHPNGTDRKCFACGQARRTHPERLEAWKAQQRTAGADTRAAAISACQLCDELGEVTIERCGAEFVRKCDHTETASDAI